MFLEISQNSQENTCARDSGTSAFLWICKMSKNTFFQRTPMVTASVDLRNNAISNEWGQLQSKSIRNNWVIDSSKVLK